MNTTSEDLAKRLVAMARRPDIVGPHPDVALTLYDAAGVVDWRTYANLCLRSSRPMEFMDLYVGYPAGYWTFDVIENGWAS
jgi:hypothetical protein